MYYTVGARFPVLKEAYSIGKLLQIKAESTMKKEGPHPGDE
jgi:hypothetical protein